MKMSNFFLNFYLSSPFWVLASPVISSHRIYRLISYAVCFVLFTVFPMMSGLLDHRGDFAGLGTLLCLGVNVLATVFATFLLIVWKKKSCRFFYGVMIGCAVVGFLGALLLQSQPQIGHSLRYFLEPVHK
jgi:hypothetical protein